LARCKTRDNTISVSLASFYFLTHAQAHKGKGKDADTKAHTHTHKHKRSYTRANAITHAQAHTITHTPHSSNVVRKMRRDTMKTSIYTQREYSSYLQKSTEAHASSDRSRDHMPHQTFLDSGCRTWQPGRTWLLGPWTCSGTNQKDPFCSR